MNKLNKFIYIQTFFLALFIIRCEPKLQREFKPLLTVPRIDKDTGQIICPACKPCPTDECSEDEKSNPWNTKCYYAVKATNDDNPLPPRDFGNGIYFFPLIQHGFAKSLSMFLKAHPELRVITIAEDSISARKGYFVVFEPKTSNGQTEGEEK